MRNSLASFILLSLAAAPVSAETLYVSDELNIAMRSGDTTSHRIIKFITSGTELKVLETNAAGTFKRVRIDGDDGKEGWVDVSKLSKQPAARAQIASLNSKMDSLRSAIGKRDSEIRELRGQLEEAKAQISQLEGFGKDKSEQLAQLKQVASRPVQLAREKQQLEVELNNALQERDRALAENQSLGDSSIKEWFMIGAGVSMGSLIIGLIIPSIRWKKKDTWGSDF